MENEERVTRLEEQMKNIASRVEKNEGLITAHSLELAELSSVKKIVYGFAGAILLAVLGAIMMSILK